MSPQRVVLRPYFGEREVKAEFAQFALSGGPSGTRRASGGKHMRPKIGTCEVCGWHGEIIRHRPDYCSRYVTIREMYLSGMTSRAVGRKLGIDMKLVLHALKAMGVKRRPRGGLNNPTGYNGRAPRERTELASA